MTQLDKLIQTLENVHQSLHRVYRFLGQIPPCQSEPGSAAPQASDIVIKWRQVDDIENPHLTVHPSASDTAQIGLWGHAG